jgi:hypothetical protein
LYVQLRAGTKVHQTESDAAAECIDLSLDRFVIDRLPSDLGDEHLCDLSILSAFVEQASTYNGGALYRETDVYEKVGWDQVRNMHAKRACVLGIHGADLGGGPPQQYANGSKIMNRFQVLVHIRLLQAVEKAEQSKGQQEATVV